LHQSLPEEGEDFEPEDDGGGKAEKRMRIAQFTKKKIIKKSKITII
jgi:hypothetical protein